MSPIPASPVSRVGALESANYLRNQLLRDADWAGMAHSVEIRCPLVDHQLLRDFAASTPTLAGDAGKRALAAAPSIPLPSLHVDRSKTGFMVPTERWIADRAKLAQPSSRGLVSRAWSLELMGAHLTPAGA
jgi:asparagine synthase (glutamine-hydrolysing)